MTLTALPEAALEDIARRVVERLSKKEAPAKIPFQSSPTLAGLFPTVDQAVAAARQAWEKFTYMPVRLRGEIIASIRRLGRSQTRALAELARQETGRGRVEDKEILNLLALGRTPGVEDLPPAAFSGDHGLTLVEPAPYGVIAAFIPAVSPSETILGNAIAMLAGGNAVVFCPHPGATRVSQAAISLIQQAVLAAEGPPNLVTTLISPSLTQAQELMRHPGVSMLVVTGGNHTVREAMGSGKKAICAGPGNPPAVVDESADLEAAGRDIVLGASLDNNTVCVAEKAIFVDEAAADQLIRVMERHGAVRLSAFHLKRLERLLFLGDPREGTINPKWMGQDVKDILQAIEIPGDHRLRLALAETGEDHPLVAAEQMLPVLPVVRVKNVDEGIDLALKAEGGRGHTAVMHSRRIDKLSLMARRVGTAIFVKNGPSYAGLGHQGEGFTSFTVATTTGEGLTRPRHFTRERRCVLKDLFRIV
jgi:acyl-CoA reductase-like NAD-dependent aldehyde dehydrogenase